MITSSTPSVLRRTSLFQKPNNAKAFDAKVLVAYRISPVLPMRPPLIFNNQLAPKAREAAHESPYRPWALEFVPIEGGGAQPVQEPPLCIGHAASKLLCLK